MCCREGWHHISKYVLSQVSGGPFSPSDKIENIIFCVFDIGFLTKWKENAIKLGGIVFFQLVITKG